MNADLVQSYLRRIGVFEPAGVDLASLEALQRAHMTAVPFENLHVFHRRGVSTDPQQTVPKIVDQRRGGWCFELNQSFGWLLEEMGFEVTRLGATVLLEGASGPQPDHCTLHVMLDRPYLVDVGFGDSFIRPLPLDAEGPHDGGKALYAFDVDGGKTTLVEIGEDGSRRPQYVFDGLARGPNEFEPSSRYLQTEPGLRWTEHPFATRLLDGGPSRVTLVHDRLKIRRDGAWTETPVAKHDWTGELMRWFGMEP
jgi:N-hydroxyarylamine O-acetyltransferase